MNPPIAPSAPITAASAEAVVELLDALGIGQLLLGPEHRERARNEKNGASPRSNGENTRTVGG